MKNSQENSLKYQAKQQNMRTLQQPRPQGITAGALHRRNK